MVLSNTSFFSAVGDTSKLSVFSLWDNLANNPGGVVALLTFFVFGVEWFDKDGAVGTGNSKDNDQGDNDGDNDDDKTTTVTTTRTTTMLFLGASISQFFFTYPSELFL